MVFWTSILAGGLFAWLATRIGFYETWTMLFNIVISIYMAVFLTPAIVDIAPAAGDTSYGTGLSLAVAATGVFLVLHGISYVFLTGQFKVSFAKVFDLVVAGVLGFLAGCLVFSFAAFAIATTPISQNSLANRLGFNSRSQRSNVAYVCWWCDAIDLVASSPGRTTTSRQIMDELLSSTQSETKDKTDPQAEPNEPPAAETEVQSSVS